MLHARAWATSAASRSIREANGGKLAIDRQLQINDSVPTVNVM